MNPQCLTENNTLLYKLTQVYLDDCDFSHCLYAHQVSPQYHNHNHLKKIPYHRLEFSLNVQGTMARLFDLIHVPCPTVEVPLPQYFVNLSKDEPWMSSAYGNRLYYIKVLKIIKSYFHYFPTIIVDAWVTWTLKGQCKYDLPFVG